MVWQGDVDATTFLYVHAKRLQSESRDGAPVANQRYRFTGALPLVRQDVRMRVIEGRGYIHIVEQPRVDNNYTLSISIEDRQPGSSFYSLALYWDDGLFDNAGQSGRSQVKWSGRVEEEVMVSCAGDHCTSQPVRGAAVMREHFKFARPLPSSEVPVRLDFVDGRGEIRLVEQPSESNGYTARVQIRDPQSGVGDYAFTLTWRAPLPTDPESAPAATGLLWSGRVEGTVRVTIHGGGAFSEVVKGAPVTAERAIFQQPLPARSDLKPAIKKRAGRGAVEIVEYPTSRNGYQLVFEVRASDSGADTYEVEVSW